jgi:hypothetical protein
MHTVVVRKQLYNIFLFFIIHARNRQPTSLVDGLLGPSYVSDILVNELTEFLRRIKMSVLLRSKSVGTLKTGYPCI